MSGTNRAHLILTARVLTFVLRLMQLTTISISFFGTAYLIFMHNHHLCRFYAYSCNDNNRKNANVPIGEVMLVVMYILVTLEFLFSTSTALAALGGSKRQDRTSQLCAAWLSVAFVTIGLMAFTSISNVRETWPVCYGLGITRFDAHAPPETNMCIVTQSAVTTGLIAWIATILIGVLALLEFRADHKVGAIRLPTTGQEASPLSVQAVDAAAIDLEDSQVSRLTDRGA